MTIIHAVIPASNESKSIADVVRLTLQCVDMCIVVDDGSQDDTSILAQKAGATVIRLSRQRGTGYATKAGLQYVHSLKNDVICLLDADGQHDPRHIPKLVKEVIRGADMVIGSRYCRPTRHVTSPIRRWGSAIISMVMRIVYRRIIYDSTSGFRAMNRRTVNFLAPRYPVFFPEPEVVIELVHKGFVIKEIAVQMKARKYGASSIRLLHAFRLFFYIIRRMVSDLGKRLI